MFFLKKIMLGLFFVFLVSLGGAGTQSNSLLAQGLGFVGILVGLVIVYVFWRMIWKGLGCLPSFLIISAITLFMMYALGLFNNGFGGIGRAIEQFLGYREESQNVPQEKQSVPVKSQFSEEFPDQSVLKEDNQKNLVSNDHENQEEDFDPDQISPDLFSSAEENRSENIPVQTSSSQPSKRKNMIENAISSMTGGNKSDSQESRAFNPNDYPVVYGSARVISGDILEIYDRSFYLFGVDAPEPNQTCADKQGRSYNCGRYAINWLKSWIKDYELECHVIKQDTKGNMIGTCAFGPYDLGAALVNAGWAVADVQQTDIYVPYELQAQAERRGLWQGSFYKPADWRKIQSRKPKIKVLKPKKRKTGIFG